MKKAQRKIRNFVLIFSMCLFLFNFCGCGIDNLIFIEEPKNKIHTPIYSYNYDESYFSFWTNEIENPINEFRGTDVYYKIYSDLTKMTSERNSLVTAATNTSTSATASSLMIDKGYKPLKVTNQNNKSLALIPATKKDQNVYIRLTDYSNLTDFSARILVSGKNLSGTDVVNVPIRNNGDEELSFNFGRNSVDSSFNKIPVNDDSDVSYTSNTTDGKWYVVLFAVGVGLDTNYTKFYSNILYLGEVTIDSNSFDN